MAYKLKYHSDVKRSDLSKIDMKNRDMIKRAIEKRLATQPEAYGKPLQRTLKGYWKLRVGDYRVVFKAFSETILIFGIIHRKEVYRFIKKRTNSIGQIGTQEPYISSQVDNVPHYTVS